MQYGPRIAAVIVYLYAGQFLSKQRTAQALAELFGVPLSSGTVAALTARAARRPPLTPEMMALTCGYGARSEGLEPPTF